MHGFGSGPIECLGYMFFFLKKNDLQGIKIISAKIYIGSLVIIFMVKAW